MVRKSGVNPQIWPGIIVGISVYILSTLIASGTIPGKMFLILVPVYILLMIVELFRYQDKPFDSLAHTFFSVLYTAVPFSLFAFSAFGRSGIETLIPYESLSFSPGIVIGFFLLIWANDSGAYLAGVSLGRHKLFERISPKKTWEGFFGGFVLALIVSWFLSGWLGVVGKFEWISVSVIISIAGTFGDLLESMLKRSLDVKDSGSILPGHGGFLDRFDSTLISFPLVYLFISLFG
jgi:phosphatidate cytidylyltransferase